MVLASQLGSLRATGWRAISDRDILFFGLKVRLAREWIERASANQELQQHRRNRDAPDHRRPALRPHQRDGDDDRHDAANEYLPIGGLNGN